MVRLRPFRNSPPLLYCSNSADKKASVSVPLSLGFLVATAVNVIFSAIAFISQLFLTQNTLGWSGVAFAYFTAAGVLSTYFGRWFFYESVVLLGPAKASVFQVSNPLFTALTAWLVVGETLANSAFWGMLIAILGLFILSVNPFKILSLQKDNIESIPDRKKK